MYGISDQYYLVDTSLMSASYLKSELCLYRIGIDHRAVSASLSLEKHGGNVASYACKISNSTEKYGLNPAAKTAG